MRLIRLVPAALILFVSAPSLAQEWIEYASRADFFTVNFPGEPKVRDITYRTEYGITLPGRVHAYEAGPSRYSVTVVDYADVQKIHAERVKDCHGYPDTCNNPWVGELRGALDYAAWGLLQRDAKVTYYAYANTDRIEGRRIQLANPIDPAPSPRSTCTKIGSISSRPRCPPVHRRRTVSAIGGLPRQGRNQGSVRHCLLQRVPTASARAVPSAARPGSAREMTSGRPGRSVDPRSRSQRCRKPEGSGREVEAVRRGCSSRRSRRGDIGARTSPAPRDWRGQACRRCS